jgi:hypothetical protein
MHEEKLNYQHKQGCRRHHRDMQIVEQKTQKKGKPAIGLAAKNVLG